MFQLQFTYLNDKLTALVAGMEQEDKNLRANCGNKENITLSPKHKRLPCHITEWLI